MGVMTNHGIEFAGEQKKKRYKRKQKNKKRKKRWVWEKRCIRFNSRKRKKMGVETNVGLEVGQKKMGLKVSVY